MLNIFKEVQHLIIDDVDYKQYIDIYCHSVYKAMKNRLQ